MDLQEVKKRTRLQSDQKVLQVISEDDLNRDHAVDPLKEDVQEVIPQIFAEVEDEDFFEGHEAMIDSVEDSGIVHVKETASIREEADPEVDLEVEDVVLIEEIDEVIQEKVQHLLHPHNTNNNRQHHLYTMIQTMQHILAICQQILTLLIIQMLIHHQHQVSFNRHLQLQI
jgi:hypothetical protein